MSEVKDCFKWKTLGQKSGVQHLTSPILGVLTL